MNLRKLKYGCEHDRFEAHGYGCPGGVFLPDDTLVIEKVDGEWPESAIQTLEQYHYPCPPELQEQVIKWLPSDVLDILAGDVNE